MPNVANSLLALDDHDEERIAHHAPRLDIPGERLERIARVAYRISQVEKDRSGAPLPAGVILKPWRGFSARERTEACATVQRILQALVLLGEAEAPEDDVPARH